MGTYSISGGGVAPGGEESYGYQDIMPMMHGLEPDRVSGAGDAFHQLADRLDSLRNALKSTGERMAANGSWQGSAAQSAMKSFQQLHDQTAQLSAQSRQSGNTLHWLGGDVMPQYKSIQSPQVASGWEQGLSTVVQATTAPGAINEAINGAPDGNSKANSAAHDYLKTFNGHLQTADNAMPKSLASPNPGSFSGNSWAPASGSHSGSNTGSGTGGGGSAGVPGVGVGGVGGGMPGSGGSGGGGAPGHLSSSSVNPFSKTHLPSTGSPSNASLQGYTPPTGGGAGSPFAGTPGGMTGGGSANPFNRMPMPGVGSRFGAPGENAMAGEKALGENALKAGKGGLPGEEGLGPKGAAGDAAGADGAAGEAAGAGAAEAGAGEAGGANAMPMGGGGGGQQDKERQRQAWMHEDTNIWGLPEEETGSTIG